jgi:thioredoxin reductase (NADPH)
VLVASGVEYRKLDVPRFADFDGAGIYYAATEMEARFCKGEEVVVVGGGNSGGQAIVFLARQARHVHVLVRGTDLNASMSRYLVDRIQGLENVTVHLKCRVTELEGDGRFATRSLFLFIGADPNTAWLRGCVELDRKGFVLTSLPGVFAAATILPRTVAVGQGRLQPGEQLGHRVFSGGHLKMG